MTKLSQSLKPYFALLVRVCSCFCAAAHYLLAVKKTITTLVRATRPLLLVILKTDTYHWDYSSLLIMICADDPTQKISFEPDQNRGRESQEG